MDVSKERERVVKAHLNDHCERFLAAVSYRIANVISIVARYIRRFNWRDTREELIALGHLSFASDQDCPSMPDRSEII